MAYYRDMINHTYIRTYTQVHTHTPTDTHAHTYTFSLTCVRTWVVTESNTTPLEIKLGLSLVYSFSVEPKPFLF